jgi:hypothetical protein
MTTVRDVLPFDTIVARYRCAPRILTTFSLKFIRIRGQR